MPEGRSIEDRPFATHIVGDSRTVQSEADACDINKMMARYQRAGTMPDQPLMRYEDFSNVDDYMAMKEKIDTAQTAFMNLPALIRKRFQNDPAELLDFVQNDENREEAEKLGLIEVSVEPEPEPEPAAAVPVVGGE